MGLDESIETEGLDRTSMEIRQNQIDLLNAISESNPNIVVILGCGSAIEMPWIDKCKACVHGFLGGQAGALAMLDVLTGKACPSGKLSETYPLVYTDTPAYHYYPGMERTAEYREGLYIGYRYYDTADVPVQFPFGYGLSYTGFAYSDLTSNSSHVSFNVTNIGKVAGAEIAQLYIRKKESAIFRPQKELKGFTKVFLNPGESRCLTILLDSKAFRYFNVKTNRFEIEAGMYDVLVGASSADIRLSAQIYVEGTNAPAPYDPELLPSYFSGKVTEVPDEEFAHLLGYPIPESAWDRTKPLDRNDTISQIFYAKSALARLVYHILTNALKNAVENGNNVNLNMLFMYNATFRGIAKVTGGRVDLSMVDGLLEIVNGHFLKGANHLVSAWLKKRKTAKESS
jgi:beta-glucosidase